MIGSTRELGSFMPKDGSFSNRNESQKERLRFVPAPMVGLGRPVSRVEMNAKYAPWTPSFPNRRFPILFLRPKARKRALTKPTLSYMGHRANTDSHGQRPRARRRSSFSGYRFLE